MQSIDQGDVGMSFNATPLSAPLNGTPFALAGMAPGGRARSHRFRWQVVLPNAPGAINVKLQGAILDPTVAANWFDLDSSTSATGDAKEVEDNVLFVRGRVETLTIGAGTTISLAILS